MLPGGLLGAQLRSVRVSHGSFQPFAWAWGSRRVANIRAMNKSTQGKEEGGSHRRFAQPHPIAAGSLWFPTPAI